MEIYTTNRRYGLVQYYVEFYYLSELYECSSIPSEDWFFFKFSSVCERSVKPICTKIWKLCNLSPENILILSGWAYMTIGWSSIHRISLKGPSGTWKSHNLSLENIYICIIRMTLHLVLMNPEASGNPLKWHPEKYENADISETGCCRAFLRILITLNVHSSCVRVPCLKVPEWSKWFLTGKYKTWR